MTLNSKKLLSMGKELFKKYKNKTVCAMRHVDLSSLCAILSCSIVDSLQLLDCSPPGSIHGDSPGKNTGVGCHALLQGIFPTQGSNPGLPHCRHVVYHLSHQGSPRILEWVGSHVPSPGELPNPGIKPGSPTLQAACLPAKLSGKPLNMGQTLGPGSESIKS